MKRFLSFILMLLYVASVSGASFDVHFCGKKIQKISIAGFGHKGCCCKKAMPENDCCKDKVVTFKSGKEHKRIESVTAPVSIPKNIPAQLPSFMACVFGEQITFVSPDYPPPLRAGSQTLLIQNSVFRI